MVLMSFVRLGLLAAVLEPAVAFTKFSDRHHQRNARSQDAAFDSMETRATPKYRYMNSKTSPYFVKSLPDVPMDIGELYAGNIPIDESDPKRNLFFAFSPKIGEPVDEITIWLNGGPGCSSLEGFFQENGHITWQPGTGAPVINQYSFVNLTNVLWVEQPVGTGFSQGKVTATSEEEIAAEFVTWFKNFQTTFGIKNYNIFVSGESYAGRYVPYISGAILDQKDTEYYNLKGALVYDPEISPIHSLEEVTAVPYVKQNAVNFNFNETFMNHLEDLHQQCGYVDLIDKYLTFPPPGNQPAKYYNFSDKADIKCDVFDLINDAALTINPCFDIYETNLQCPILSDILQFPTELTLIGNPYFNRSDVKEAMHAPQDVSWAECAAEPVFIGGPKGSGGPQGEGDLSIDPIQKVLPQVIEATNRVLIGNGDFDMIIISNGTLMSIQNMTWNGMLGFQEKPSTNINIREPDLQYAAVFNNKDNKEYYGGLDGPQGITGIQHYERGLMWVETFQSGHMQPQYAARTAYRHLEWVLGRVDKI
ncbi:MAG: hypothetical protein M1828_005644 [Chrysothrix sp. TS-e1954]|nr:MAG: hypothetical protein M1828_005644 [Chrysothrix sp. TS-e1954]